LNPLVTVVCLCYNHKPFIRQAVESVVNQSYRPIQIIVADDASRDGSIEEIEKLSAEYPELECLLIAENIGNCRAFNRAYALAKGDYIIDFATDDIMLPDRITKQIQMFRSLDQSVGVVYTDATYIDESGKFLRHHFPYLFYKKLIVNIPQGDVYSNLVSTYFIASPTMMVRREVLDRLGGYDENLSYEDFDFWVRSSRDYKYAFLNESLTQIRKVKQSMSTGWYVPGDKQLHSTYLVCKKIQQLNRTREDHLALVKRVRYELRQSIFSQNYSEANNFMIMLRELRGVRNVDKNLFTLNKFKIPLSPLRRLYHWIRYS
jgi:glycosyltransferase involved in cell wall biosynthesis